MKPNNYYYREIAKRLGYTWDEKHHSSYYFMRKIAEQCGYTYTARKTSNKYLRDFHTYITGNTPVGFEYNIYYLYNIAKSLYPQTESAKTENYYLRIICEAWSRKSTSLTISLDKNFLEVGERVTVSGRLTDSDGNPIANASLVSHSNSQTANMTTDANGYYSIKWYYGTSAYNTVAHHYVTYAGDLEYEDSQSETKDVSFRRTSTLSLETPMITYTDEFDVEGSLTDGLGEPISNATVTLTWNDGSDHTATTTTSNTGGILLHRDAVTTAGTYSFQLSFDGGSSYVASNSSVVNVVPDKETSVLNITSPSSGSTVSSDSVTVSGTLKDNDNTAMSGESVSFTLNNVSVGTATVESDGTFSKTLTGLVADSNSITVSFAETTTHTNASQSITVYRSAFDGLSNLSLTNGSQILSYADEQSTPNSQYATVTAQLLDGQSSALVSGVPVVFGAYQNDVLITGSEQTVNTDSNGQASYTYRSQGLGNVVIKAVPDNRTLLTKTYSIRDGIFYDVSSSSNVSKYGSSSAFSYDSTEQAYYIATSSAKNITRESIVGDFDFEISMDFKATSSNTVFYIGESNGSNYECQGRIVGSSTSTQKGVATYYTNGSIVGRMNRTLYSLDTTKWYHLKVTRVGNTLTAQILDGDTVIATATDSNVTGTTGNVSWHNYVQTGTMYWKNILFIRL